MAYLYLGYGRVDLREAARRVAEYRSMIAFTRREMASLCLCDARDGDGRLVCRGWYEHGRMQGQIWDYERRIKRFSAEIDQQVVAPLRSRGG